MARSEDPEKTQMSFSTSGEMEFKIYRLEVMSDELFQSSKYDEALEMLKTLHEIQHSKIKTMMMIADCYMFLDKFNEAFYFIKYDITPMILKEPLVDAKVLIKGSQRCKESKMFFRSLHYIWGACAVYKAQQPTSDESLESIINCMRIMEELVLKMFGESKVLESNDCSRFAEIHVRHLLELAEFLTSRKIADKFMLDKIRLLRFAGIASCYLLLGEYERSIEYFYTYHDHGLTINDVGGVNELRFGAVAKFIAKIGSRSNLVREELKKMTSLMSDNRHFIMEYKTAHKDEIKLKEDVDLLVENFTLNVQNAEEAARKEMYKLLRLFFVR